MNLKSILAFLVCIVALKAGASEQSKLDDLLEKIYQYDIETMPLFATSEGVHDKDDLLPDLSPAGLKSRDTQYLKFLSQLQQLDKDQLTRTSQITLLMQTRSLQAKIDSYRFNAHYMPLTSEYGFHENIGGLANRVRLKDHQDYRNYLSRLDKFPVYFEQQIAWMKKGIETGFVQPKIVLEGFELTVKTYFEHEVEKSAFFKPFADLSGLSLTDSEKSQLLNDAKTVINDKVYPAYKSFYDFLVDEYIPAAKFDIAAYSWKHGKAYYRNQVEYYTTTDMSADEIHQLGLSEVARIRAEMQKVIDELEFDGDINAFIHYLRTDPKFYAKSAEELLKHAAYFSKKIDAKLPQLFYKLPRTPYGVEPVPDNIAPKYTTGRYVSPRRDDQPGLYWVNTYALDKRPLYAIPALTLHEAVPGHHLQISLASEMKSLPFIRRRSYISAFGEGWGLYSEFLGKEVGIYEDPYDEFGRLSYEMWRACRLVVDTGMHTKGWSRQRALDYMLENTALSEHNVRTEIDRYISWPAQALSYKIGELEIKRLRAKAEQSLGNKFDLRAFHDAVLAHGSVPLSVLDENISQFIQVHSSD